MSNSIIALEQRFNNCKTKENYLQLICDCSDRIKSEASIANRMAAYTIILRCVKACKKIDLS